MKTVIMLVGLTLSTIVYAQPVSEKEFDTWLMTLEPVKTAAVTESQFNKGQFILRDIRSATSGSIANLNVADYWNAVIALINLGQEKHVIEIAFEKAKKADPATLCGYCHISKADLGKVIPEVYLPFFATCQQTGEKQIKKDIPNGLNPSLIEKITSIEKADGRYRHETEVDWAKQTPLDKRNQHSIDSLFTIYKTYLGTSLVGEQLNYVMWMVIQHSALEMMERYLPVVEVAVSQGELPVVPFKMLIDRIHSVRYGYQIFGSQMNVPLAVDSIQNGVREKYKIK